MTRLDDMPWTDGNDDPLERLQRKKLESVQRLLRERVEPRDRISTFLGVPIEQFTKEDLILILSFTNKKDSDS